MVAGLSIRVLSVDCNGKLSSWLSFRIGDGGSSNFVDIEVIILFMKM